ncbi:MAG: hypothetical protein IJX39_00250 [Clostridia bacterium]|nr:hypothetical protein [Clostridia bacterium]
MAENKKNVNEATEMNVDKQTGEVFDTPVSPTPFGIPTVSAPTVQSEYDAEGYDDDLGNDEDLRREGDAIATGLLVRRVVLKPRTRGAKPVHVYNIEGELRGQKISVAMNPPDKRGFSLLDLVYGDAVALPLWMVPYEMKDDNGQKISGCTYKIMSLDAEGDVLECKMKPRQDSDKRMLECLIRKAQKKAAQ